MRFKVLAVVVCVFVAGGPAVAQEADALQAARELVAETAMDGMVENLVERTWPAMEPAIRKSLPDATAETIKGIRADYVRIVTQHASGLIARTPEIYARLFTAEELRGLLAFYRSPIGRKSLMMTPRIVGDMIKITAERMPVVTAEINEAFRHAMRDRGVELDI